MMSTSARTRGFRRRAFLAGAAACALTFAATSGAQAAGADFDGVWKGEVNNGQGGRRMLEISISQSASGRPVVIVNGSTYEGSIAGNQLTYRATFGTGYLTKVDEKNLDCSYLTNNGYETKFKLSKQ